MSGGAGGKDAYYWYTKGLGAVVINTPNYGKMAADSSLAVRSRRGAGHACSAHQISADN